MTENRFLTAVRVGARPIQASVWSASVPVAEIIACSGFDSIWIDLQHGSIDLADVTPLVAVIASHGVTPFARVPSGDPGIVSRVLDAGVQGVVCPDVRDASQARAFVSACRYPPAGTRGFGPSRPQYLGDPRTFDPSTFPQAQNESIMVVVQIESPQGYQNMAEILGTPGVDAVFPGMVDYALLEYGELLRDRSFLHPKVREPLSRVIEIARAADVSVGLPAGSPAEIGPLLDLGADWIQAGGDLRWIGAGARQSSAGAREAIEAWRGAASTGPTA
jgi:4-hydroxy-2-oxoheptanedioate aldolase